MWNIEKIDDSALPFYVFSAILDAHQWLRHQQTRFGLSNFDNRGAAWTLSSHMAGRYFAVARYPSSAFGESSHDSILVLAQPEKRWNESREASGTPSPEVAKHPLAWFACIPWTAHLSKDRDALVLVCPEQKVRDLRSPSWSLTLPVSLAVWRVLHADYLRQKKGNLSQASRFALGDGVFVPALGFDVEWGPIVHVPARIDPLVVSLQKSSASEREPKFLEIAS